MIITLPPYQFINPHRGDIVKTAYGEGEVIKVVTETENREPAVIVDLSKEAKAVLELAAGDLKIKGPSSAHTSVGPLLGDAGPGPGTE